jgi:hypothetical protein
MSDDPRQPKKPFVDLNSSFDRIYWRHRFQTTDAILVEAVEAVGPNPEDIAACIQSRRVENRMERKLQDATIFPPLSHSAFE